MLSEQAELGMDRVEIDRRGWIGVNQKAVGQIFSEGIYLGVSVEAHL